jgi:uncharacterized protein YecT (DUF1311 family)
MRAALAGLVLALGIATASAAAPEQTPAPREIAAIDGCLARADQEKTGYRDCIGKAVDACLDVDNPGAVFDCQIRETAIWDRKLDQSYAVLMQGLTSEAKTRLRDMQRAWLGYREKRCSYEQLWSPSTTGALKREHGCRLEMTAERMIDLAVLRERLDHRGGHGP